MGILSYIKTVWVDKVTAVGPTNLNKIEVGVENNNVGLIDLDQSNKYVLLTYISAGLFSADTVIAFDDKKEILIELEATELNPTTPVKISVDNQVTEYLVKVGDVLNSLLVSDGQGNKFTLHRDGSVAIIAKEEPSKTDEIEYNETIQSQQTIVPVEGSPFGDERIDGESAVQQIPNGDFIDGDTDWAIASATGSVTDGIYSFTANAANGRITLVIPSVNGESYHFKTRFKASLSNVALLAVGASPNFVNHSGGGEYETLSFIGVATGTSITIRIQDSNTSGWQQVDVDYVMAIPLLSVKQQALTLSQLNAKYPVYFDSLKPVENPEIKVRNENLFDINQAFEQGGFLGDGSEAASSLRIRNINPVTLKPDTIYYYKDTLLVDGTLIGLSLVNYYDASGNFISQQLRESADVNFTVPVNAAQIRFTLRRMDNTALEPDILSKNDLDIRINEGSAAKTFIKHDNSSKKYPLQTLRGVTNGTEDVADYIDTENNVLHKLVKYDFNDILQNTTGGSVAQELTNTIRYNNDLSVQIGYKIPGSDLIIVKATLIIDKVRYPQYSNTTLLSLDDIGIAVTVSGAMRIRFNKTTIGGNTVAHVEAYLQAHNVELEIELAEEVITENINVDGIAFAYKNMTIEIIQDNGFSNSWKAKHAQNDPETIKLLGESLEKTQKELDESGIIKGENGKNYRVVAAVIRNTGAGWDFVGGEHAPINIVSVSNNDFSIEIIYSFIAKNVVSLIASPDETMAKDKMIMGASVGVNIANISLYQNKSLGGFVSYGGAVWSGVGDETFTYDFTAGILTITHSPISGLKASAISRDGVYITNLGSISSTTTKISFRDYSGTLITVPDTSMKVFFERTSQDSLVNPNDYSEANSNIWIYGIMEV